MSFLERLKLSSQISGKEKSSPEISTRRRYIAEKLQPYVLMGGVVLAAPVLNGCSENDKNFDYENVGSVALNQWSGNNNPTWGQNSINLSPAIYPANGMNRTALFSSDKGGNFDIYCSQTIDGGNTWSPEQPVTVSSGAEVNDPVYPEQGVAICAGNSNCPSPKIVFSTGRSGNSNDIYWGDINLANCEASNVAAVGGDINAAFVGNTYLSVDNTNGKVYYIRTQIPYTADVGTWIRSQIPGVTTTLHGGISVYGNHLYVAASDCPNGQGSQDICRYDFDGTTASNVINLNDIPTSDAINDTQAQTTPFLDDAGDLWYSDGGKIARKLAVGQGGSGGAGGSGGSGGSTGGSGGSTGGSGGMAGSGGMTGGAGGSTGGMGGAPSGGAGGAGAGGMETGGAGGVGASAGAGGMETGGSGGTGGSVDECPIAVETKAGECEVQNCENLAVGDAALLVSKGENADCVFSYPPTNSTDILYQTGQGTSTLQGRDVYQKTTNYVVRLEHPREDHTIDAIQLPLGNGSNLILGAMGTIEDMETFLKDGKLFVRVGVIEKQAFLQIKNSEGQAVDVVIESKGTNIIDAGESFEFAVDDLVALSETIGKKPEGPAIKPPTEDGCSISAVGPKNVSEDTHFQLMAILGLMGLAAARRRRREEQA